MISYRNKMPKSKRKCLGKKKFKKFKKEEKNRKEGFKHSSKSITCKTKWSKKNK